MYFPRAYPDEWVGSLLARASIHTGLTFRELVIHLTGLKTGNISFFLPRMLALLAKPARLRPEELLQGHTVFPFATAFMPPATMLSYREALLAGTLGRNTAAFVQSLTLNASRYVFCPECIKSDLDEYGETYWHRVHFLPGLSDCPWHHCTLLFLLPSHDGGLPIRQPPSFEDICTATETTPISDVHAFIDIFVRRSISTVNPDWKRREEWVSKYRAMACKKGYGTRRDGVVGRQIAINLLKMLTQETLDSLGCAYEGKLTSSWPANMVRPYAQHQSLFSPIRHLLLYAFLATSAPHEGEFKYRVNNLKSEKYEQVDKQFVKHIHARWAKAKKKQEYITVKELLTDVPMSATFFNQRSLFPMTVSLLEEFKRSNQSRCQASRRPCCWRKNLGNEKKSKPEC